MASVCSFQTSYAQTLASPALAKWAANRLPTAPQPTTQILILVPGSTFFSSEEFPGYIRQTLAFSPADAIGILCIKTNLAVLIHDLRMQRENHVLLQRHIALGPNRGILQHGRADAVAGEMAERESMFGKSLGHCAMHCTGEFAGAH